MYGTFNACFGVIQWMNFYFHLGFRMFIHCVSFICLTNLLSLSFGGKSWGWFLITEILLLQQIITNIIIILVYIILVWHIISEPSNLDIYCYHCLIITLIFHLKVLINFFIIIIIIIVTIVGVVVVVLLLFIIYTINLPVVRPRSCRVIYYFNTPALERRHQSFGRVSVTGFSSTLDSILSSLRPWNATLFIGGGRRTFCL